MLDSCRILASEGFSITYLPVQANGIVDLEVRRSSAHVQLRSFCMFYNSPCPCVQLLEASIRPDTSLLSVMTINNEIGVKQPMKEIGKRGNADTMFFSTRSSSPDCTGSNVG